MDMKVLLEQLLQSGKTLAEQGSAKVEQTLNVPKDDAGRASMASQVGTGAAVAGVLALLLGTNAGRRVGGAGLKLGSLAAIGGLAYQMYQQWNASNTTGATTPASVAEPAALEAPAVKASTDVLLKALIAAAKADGHVDAQELETIRQQLTNSGLQGDLNSMIMDELVKPLSAQDIAALAQGDKAIAAEIYVASSLLLDENNEAERVYLSDLQTALGLPAEIVATLKAQMAA